ncbi:MAG: Wzt carbohydrate-binding domain-containing protein, partial [Armatimonadetes bacterium]|nr:Wzt carbohydrate-binding domain-containing protein [Armatimonadota bacterium]
AERLAAEALLQVAERERKADPTRARLTSVTLRDSLSVPRTHFKSGDHLSVEIAWKSVRPLPEPAIGFDIFDAKTSQHLFTTSNYDHQISFSGISGEGTLHFTIPFLALPMGEYRVQVNLYPDSTQPEWWSQPEDQLDDAVRFTVTHERVTNGLVFLPVHWGERA